MIDRYNLSGSQPDELPVSHVLKRRPVDKVLKISKKNSKQLLNIHFDEPFCDKIQVIVLEVED